MIQTTCDNCGKVFECQNWRVREKEEGKRKHLFCSSKCCGEFNKAKPNRVCPVCGKEYYLPADEAKRIKHESCCSYECTYEYRKTLYAGEGNHQYGLKGDKNASWKSDEKISHYGYRLIRKLDHPFKNCDDMVFEHRLVAEEYLLTDECSIEIDGKRYLHPDYVVHHKDRNKLNNDPSNLEIMLRSEHTRLHIKKNLKH